VQWFVGMAEAGGHGVPREPLKQSPLYQRLEQHILRTCRRNSMSDKERVKLKLIGGFGNNYWLLLKEAMEKSAELWSSPKLRKASLLSW
jgi:hypothetical protein